MKAYHRIRTALVQTELASTARGASILLGMAVALGMAAPLAQGDILYIGSESRDIFRINSTGAASAVAALREVITNLGDANTDDGTWNGVAQDKTDKSK